MALQKEKKIAANGFKKKDLKKKIGQSQNTTIIILQKKASALPFFVCQKSYDISKKVYKNRNM